MNDQELRVWAIEMVYSENRHIPNVIEEAEELVLYVTGKKVPVTETPFAKSTMDC